MANTADEKLITNVENFVISFRNRIENIRKITVGSNPNIYKKILYVSVLEGLAKAMNPSLKGSRHRFIKLVQTFGGWVDGERISLPHLVAALERTPDDRFEQIRKFAFSQLQNWGRGGPFYLDRDPLLPEVQKLWPKENGADVEIKSLRIKLENLQHVELLYEYRNYLVHMSIQPTVGFEEGGDLDPFYDAINEHPTVLGSKASEWHLVYPSGFLEQLCKTCLTPLEQYLKDNKIDPSSAFWKSRYVVERFNNDVQFPVLKPFYIQRP